VEARAAGKEGSGGHDCLMVMESPSGVTKMFWNQREAKVRQQCEDTKHH